MRWVTAAPRRVPGAQPFRIREEQRRLAPAAGVRGLIGSSRAFERIRGAGHVIHGNPSMEPPFLTRSVQRFRGEVSYTPASAPRQDSRLSVDPPRRGSRGRRSAMGGRRIGQDGRRGGARDRSAVRDRRQSALPSPMCYHASSDVAPRSAVCRRIEPFLTRSSSSPA